jgi:5-methylthioadenosine/S-adenosylhomocysteine deaminase
MRKIDLIIKPRYLVPVVPKETVLERHGVAVDQGRIIDIAPWETLDEKYQAGDTRELGEHVLMPGLVNAHTHSAMALFRGLADDLPLMTWLNDHIWPAEGKFVDADFVREGSLLAMAEMIRGGTTCFNDQYFFPNAVAEAAHKAGMRGRVSLLVIDFPTAWAKDHDEYFERGMAVHEEWGSHSLIECSWAPHAPYTVADSALKRIGELSASMDLPIHIHVHETADEVQGGLDKDGKRPMQRLDDLGLLDERFTAVHMTQLNDEEIALCAQRGVHVVHCPESNLKLASGMARIADLSDAGVNIAIGTDGAASNNDLCMFSEMRTAALLGKAVAGRPEALPAADVLAMATINGARALRLDDRIGSIEVGKHADLTAVDFSSLEAQPCYDVIAQLIYATHRSQVSDVWVEGRCLLREQTLTTLDEVSLKAMTQRWQAQIEQHGSAS